MGRTPRTDAIQKSLMDRHRLPAWSRLAINLEERLSDAQDEIKQLRLEVERLSDPDMYPRELF